MTMRNIVWNNLENIDYQANYLKLCAAYSSSWSNWYQAGIGFLSASFLGSWVYFKPDNSILIVLVGVGQLAQFLAPYIRFFKHQADFMNYSFELQRLNQQYRLLFHEIDFGNQDEAEIGAQHHELQGLLITIDEKYRNVGTPNFDWLAQKAALATKENLRVNHNV